MKYSASVTKAVKAYYEKIDRAMPTLARHSRNLNSLYLSGQIKPVYHRDALVTTMSKILLRVSKPNVLLTGVAGCGKTALAEALAISCTERALAWKEKDLQRQAEEVDINVEVYGEDYSYSAPKYKAPPHTPLCDCVIYDFSLNSAVGGTKYRGEFEERIDKILQECKDDRRIIIFIDEIHQINAIGAAEGCSSLGQILKPALARGNITVIGATTTEEAEILMKDKALARRFTQVNVDELKGEGAKKTADGIFVDYLKAHKIKADTTLADIILQMINYYLPKTTFPDNFINVVDETLAGARYDELAEVNLDHFKATIGRMAGVVIT